MKTNKNILLILFTSDFYKYYNALNLASTYQASNKAVTVFYFGYSCNFLKKNWEKYDKLKINKRIIKRKMADYLEVLNLCSELKVKFLFCNTALQFLNIKENNLIKNIKIESSTLYHVINKYKDCQTLFI